MTFRCMSFIRVLCDVRSCYPVLRWRRRSLGLGLRSTSDVVLRGVGDRKVREKG